MILLINVMLFLSPDVKLGSRGLEGNADVMEMHNESASVRKMLEVILEAGCEMGNRKD